MKKIDWSRPIQTNDLGLPSEVVGEFRFQDKSYKVVLVDNKYLWNVDAETGCAMYSSIGDIINVPEHVERWVNVYECDVYLRRSREDADLKKVGSRAGLVKLTIVDGKLVDAEVVE